MSEFFNLLNRANFCTGKQCINMAPGGLPNKDKLLFLSCSFRIRFVVDELSSDKPYEDGCRDH